MSYAETHPLWTPRRPRWILVAVTVAAAALSPVFSVLGTWGVRQVRYPVIPVVLGAGLLALQLRHSFAAARGERPPGGLWTLLAMAVLVYAPMPWFTFSWLSTQALLMASSAMVLRGRVATLVAAAPALGTATYLPIYEAWKYGARETLLLVWWDCGYWLLSLTTVAVVLYGAAWLARTAGDLQAARTELAELAIGRERLRVSRDLHDLLGQSLSAVSLKGDLALRLLAGDPVAAHAEIESLTGVARDALRSIQAVTRNTHVIDLRSELDGAARLLAAAGVTPQIEVAAGNLTVTGEEVFAWAVREGVTNVLRHSNANQCSISIHRHDAQAILQISNDGAPPAAGAGTGLTGLAERARAASGRMSAGPVPGGHFLLTVEIPLEPA
ncbi:MAG TPA: histidine kinase [Streptosporangiaceae bacterium]